MTPLEVDAKTPQERGAVASTSKVPLPREAEEFLSWLGVERGRSANTLAAYRRDLAALADWLAGEERALDACRESDLMAYAAARHAGTRPARVEMTIDATIVRTRSLVNVCVGKSVN